MWKLIIKQFKPTDYGYDREEQVEFVSEDIAKLTRIIEYFNGMTNKKTEFVIRKVDEEEKKDGTEELQRNARG
jgi:hypothetical protein